ncbi:hypothetical protein DFH29DRAFT_870985 [Suillus ampliporus]|nr:hypothetical protein DFH29DRAFT_870985 [Suillus ampliporus]
MAYFQPHQMTVNSGKAGSHGHYGRYSHPPPHPSTIRAPMPPHWFLSGGRRAERVPRPQGITPSQESFPRHHVQHRWLARGPDTYPAAFRMHLVIALRRRMIFTIRAKRKPVARGWEKWTFSENGVRPSDVIILSVHYYKKAWIPELYVIE